MILSDKILIIQTAILFLTLLAAFYIGYKQNKINKEALDIKNFVDTFVMPQQVLGQDEKGEQKLIYWNLIVKNASSYPIYLNSFCLNGIEHSIGSSVIPNGSDNWYGFPIPNDVQEKGELSLKLEFEDYLNNKYTSRHFGKLENGIWQIKSEKRIKI